MQTFNANATFTVIGFTPRGMKVMMYYQTIEEALELSAGLTNVTITEEV